MRLARAIALGVALLAASSGAAQRPTIELEGASEASHDQPTAWRMEHAELPGELLLLGSIHALRPTDYPLPALVDELIDAADQVAFELDLDAAAQDQSALVAAAQLPPRRSLAALLGADRYAFVNDKAAAHGLPLERVDRFDVWFVALSLTAMAMREIGFATEYGVEQYVYAQARAMGKTVLGLETIDDQIEVFSGLSRSQQIALLEQAVGELEGGNAKMTQLVDAWREGRLDALREGLLEDFDAFPTLYRRLIVERNRAWADRLSTFAQSNARTLVVVGALHIVGDDSLIQMLRERGFSARAQ